MYRKIKVRFKVLRNGVEYAELYAKDSPSLYMSKSSDIKMSMQGTFLSTIVDTKGKEAEMDWLKDEIQPVLIIDGEEYPLAVLMPAQVTPAKKSTGKEVSVQAFDRCWRVSDTKTESLVHIAAGTNYITAISGFLAQAGVAIVIQKPTTATISEDREDWGIGTSLLTIVNKLLSEINYENLWFNANGAAMLQPVQFTSAQNIKRIYTDKPIDPRNLNAIPINNISPEVKMTNDIYKSPNVFVCICSNADKSGSMIATSENTNPQSILSTVRRGRRIAQVIKVDNIASQEALQDYADKLRDESMVTGEIYNFQTLLLPNCGVSDITALQMDDLNALCVEEDWRMTLGVGGVMEHSLKRVVVNIG